MNFEIYLFLKYYMGSSNYNNFIFQNFVENDLLIHLGVNSHLVVSN